MGWVILICLALLYLYLSGGKEESDGKDEQEIVPVVDPGPRVTKTGLVIKGLEESRRTQAQCPPDED